ncbi:hypothetical protein FA15DRAFT_672586 [Coprinopsis marcescibilis]|uniref:SnoaL-like domain-containing protein n=1 Tax=Coprinopsis marcescibilis TaxID=230819 RepID=A0A5C3KM41_COPMA|nr:hypothetical protein FA15DRAFT_672586 [Coprinopsis marcescibilis]
MSSKTSLRMMLVALALCLCFVDFVLGAPADADAAEVEVAGRPGGPGKPKPRKVCNRFEKGDLDKKQQDALADFAHLYFVARDIDTAFNTLTLLYRQYIRHNPNAEQGRHTAIPALKALWGNPLMTTSNRSWFAGQNYGMLHFKFIIGATNTSMAVVDKFRFEGTCIVEHWDVMQAITGNEPNPIAFF